MNEIETGSLLDAIYDNFIYNVFLANLFGSPLPEIFLKVIGKIASNEKKEWVKYDKDFFRKISGMNIDEQNHVIRMLLEKEIISESYRETERWFKVKKEKIAELIRSKNNSNH